MRLLGRVAGTTLALGITALLALWAIKVNDDASVDAAWRTLADDEGAGEPFRPEMVQGLPEPARRYFLHAIQPGTRLAAKLHWAYGGEIRPSRDLPWLSMEAEQVLVAGRGFVWKARASKGPLVMTAADYYLEEKGRMRIALFGLVPVVDATGPDLSRSALGRLLVEGLALPSSLLPGPNVEIQPVDDSRFTVVLTLHGERTPLTLTVDAEGRLKEFEMQRWGDQTEDKSFRYLPYGGTASAERTFGGYTIPSKMAIGWWYGTEQYLEVIRLDLAWAAMS